VSVTGWTAVPPGFAEAAHRYVAQIDLSLAPSTVKHIEHDLREFGTWVGQSYPDVATCAELNRNHIEHYKTWVGAKDGCYTAKPLNRVSIKNRLINLRCFFDLRDRLLRSQHRPTGDAANRKTARKPGWFSLSVELRSGVHHAVLTPLLNHRPRKFRAVP